MRLIIYCKLFLGPLRMETLKLTGLEAFGRGLGLGWSLAKTLKPPTPKPATLNPQACHEWIRALQWIGVAAAYGIIFT